MLSKMGRKRLCIVKRQNSPPKAQIRVWAHISVVGGTGHMNEIRPCVKKFDLRTIGRWQLAATACLDPF